MKRINYCGTYLMLYALIVIKRRFYNNGLNFISTKLLNIEFQCTEIKKTTLHSFKTLRMTDFWIYF